MDDQLPDSNHGVSQVADRGRNYSDLAPPAFVKLVAADVVARGPSPTPPINCEARWRIAKFWYGADPSVHYELAVHEKMSQLEIGLHAESSPEWNRGLYAALDRCMLDIQRELGTSMWLEEWDRGWIRLYETHPLWPLDTGRALDVSTRLLEVISVLQPLYESICHTLGYIAPPQKQGRRK